MERRVAARLDVVCSADGSIRRVVRDDLGLVHPSHIGRLLTGCVDACSVDKCEQFLLALITRGMAFDWELCVPTNGGALLLHFAGLARADGTLAVVAATTHAALLQLLELETHGAVRPDCESPARGQRDELDALAIMSQTNNELVNLQRELTKRNAELTSLTRERNQLLAMAAHDLRNPIAIVESYCDLLLSNTADPLPARDAQIVNNVRQATHFMLHLLRETLDFARIESGQLELQVSHVSLVQLVEECVDQERALAESKGIKLIVEGADSDLPLLLLDRLKIEQVLSNLLSNAIKYSHRGTRVDISIGRSAHMAQVRVADQGQGIAQAELPLLFRPFQTTSTRPTGGESSAGLGLSIVKKLVELHGGHVSVKSEQRRGTVFTVELPLDGARTLAWAANTHESKGEDEERSREQRAF